MHTPAFIPDKWKRKYGKIDILDDDIFTLAIRKITKNKIEYMYLDGDNNEIVVIQPKKRAIREIKRLVLEHNLIEDIQKECKIDLDTFDEDLMSECIKCVIMERYVTCKLYRTYMLATIQQILFNGKQNED